MAKNCEQRQDTNRIAPPSLLPPRVEQWDAWLASDLEGAQAVVRAACAASEPSLAAGLVAKARFSCGDELEGVRVVSLCFLARIFSA